MSNHTCAGGGTLELRAAPAWLESGSMLDSLLSCRHSLWPSSVDMPSSLEGQTTDRCGPQPPIYKGSAWMLLFGFILQPM